MTTAYLINLFSMMIQPPPGAPAINARALLHAIAQVESNCGTFPTGQQSRYEPGFRKLYVDKPIIMPGVLGEVRANYGGDRVATSYGLTQVMALVAYEMGMPAHKPPEDLYNPVVCLYWTIEFLNKRVMPNAMKSLGGGEYPATEEGFIKAVGDAYNSGNARDGNVPVEYVAKLWKAYEEAKHGQED
jgi:hypothetical protein